MKRSATIKFNFRRKVNPQFQRAETLEIAVIQPPLRVPDQARSQNNYKKRLTTFVVVSRMNKLSDERRGVGGRTTERESGHVALTLGDGLEANHLARVRIGRILQLQNKRSDVSNRELLACILARFHFQLFKRLLLVNHHFWNRFSQC